MEDLGREGIRGISNLVLLICVPLGQHQVFYGPAVDFDMQIARKPDHKMPTALSEDLFDLFESLRLDPGLVGFGFQNRGCVHPHQLGEFTRAQTKRIAHGPNDDGVLAAQQALFVGLKDFSGRHGIFRKIRIIKHASIPTARVKRGLGFRLILGILYIIKTEL